MQDVLDQFLERPPPELDAALDAAAQCFARHGLAHTSVPVIARELGVSKATVYRQVGSIDDVLRMVLARELHELVDELTANMADASGAEAVITLAVTVTRHATDHPLVQKLLADEPHLVGELLHHLPMVIAATSNVLSSYLAAIRVDDPTGLADLVVRLATVAVLAPPPDLDAYFRSALVPHLQQ